MNKQRGILFCVFLLLSPAISAIQAGLLQPKVWLVRDKDRQTLQAGEVLQPGDRVATGAQGGAKLDLPTKGFVLLEAASEIAVLDEGGGNSSAISMLEGRVCADLSDGATGAVPLRISLGEITKVDVSKGALCIKQNKQYSVVKLLAGTIEIRNREQDVLVLGEVGAEYQIFPDGKTDLVLPEAARDKTAPLRVPRLANAKRQSPAPKAELPKSPATPAKPLSPPAPAKATTISNKAKVGYVVYLFSSKSDQAAQKLNDRLIDAGYSVEVISTVINAQQYYRVAAQGFTEKADAKAFSDSIKGKLGITDTWIDRLR